MKTEIDNLKRLELSAGVLAIILAVYNILLIASRLLSTESIRIRCHKIFWRSSTVFTGFT